MGKDKSNNEKTKKYKIEESKESKTKKKKKKSNNEETKALKITKKWNKISHYRRNNSSIKCRWK